MPKVLNIKTIGQDAARFMIARREAVYIGRKGRYGRYGAWPQSKWRNEFRSASRDKMVADYRAWIVQQPELMAVLSELRGKNLLCWCAPESCHGDVLLELANQ
jgi:hypothetical protein